MLEGNVFCFPSPGPSQLQNLSKNSRFQTLIVSKRKTEQINFFKCLSNLKNLVLPNGSKNEQNAIQIGLK